MFQVVKNSLTANATSLCSASSVDCQRDTARICCWAPAPAARRSQRAGSYRSISSARKALSSKPVARRCCCRSMGQTDVRMDWRTLVCYIDTAPHTIRAASIRAVLGRIRTTENAQCPAALKGDWLPIPVVIVLNKSAILCRCAEYTVASYALLRQVLFDACSR